MFRLPVSDRLELQRWEADHAELVFSLVRQNREHLGRWIPWVHHVHSVEDVARLIQVALAQFTEGRSIQLGICDAGRLVGGIGLIVNHSHQAGELGYWLIHAEQGKGLVTEAARALLAYGFQSLQLHRIELRCSTRNYRSQAVAERLGFQREGLLQQSIEVNGVFQDQFLYSQLALDAALAPPSRRSLLPATGQESFPVPLGAGSWA